jgi:hypothetical protein
MGAEGQVPAKENLTPLSVGRLYAGGSAHAWALLQIQYTKLYLISSINPSNIDEGINHSAHIYPHSQVPPLQLVNYALAHNLPASPRLTAPSIP